MKIHKRMRAVVIGTTLVMGIGLAAVSARAADYGKVTVDTRLRYETADIDGFEDADATTLRLRLGYLTPEYKGLQGMVEGEFTTPLDRDSYNAANVYGDRDKGTIADIESYQFDQLYLSYSATGITTRVGRQVIILDNQRFIGAVGWRQNRQTYDAATVSYSPVDEMKLYYGYVDKVVRIFGSFAPSSGANAEDADSNSHLIHGSYTFNDLMKLTVYSYLLDLKDVPPASSCNSYGTSLKGSVSVAEETSVNYLLEYAMQTDAGDNTLDYDTDYYHIDLNGTYKRGSAGIGYEVLGSDNTGDVDAGGTPVYASFQTPLATLHAFNGYADRFLVTPPKGLEDFYVTLGYSLPLPGDLGPLNAAVWYHDFSSDIGSEDFGDEWDAVLAKPIKFAIIPGEFTALVKYADYSAGDVGVDTKRVITEINYKATF